MTTLTATQATLKTALDAAQPGDVLKLQGEFNYPATAPLRWGNKTYSTPVVIDASGAKASNWYLGNIEGVEFVGGEWKGLRIDNGRRLGFEGVRGQGTGLETGLWINRGNRVSVRRSQFSDLLFAIRYDMVDDVETLESQFTRLRSDAARHGECHRVRFNRNACLAAVPTDGAHPDGAQFWSRATSLPACDIEVCDNLIVGMTQGIFLGNHVRTYKAGTKLADGTVLSVDTVLDDGGFDRVNIARNRIIGGYSQAICVGGGRDVRVIGNHVSTYEGAENQAMINLNNCTGLVRTGNLIDAGDGRKEIRDPA